MDILYFLLLVGGIVWPLLIVLVLYSIARNLNRIAEYMAVEYEEEDEEEEAEDEEEEEEEEEDVLPEPLKKKGKKGVSKDDIHIEDLD